MSEKRGAGNGGGGGMEVVFDRVSEVDPRTGGGRHAVEEMSFTVQRGAHIALVGKPGCGKGILLELAAGLELPDSGAVIADGKATSAMSYRELQRHRMRTGFAFRHRALLVNTTIFENLALPLRYHCMLELGEDGVRDRVRGLLREFDIEAVEANIPAQVNSSALKRALIARALVLEPDLLMIDEPQESLTREEEELVQRAIESRRKARGTTLVQADHDGQWGVLVPERVLIIDEGRLVKIGGPDLTLDAVLRGG